MKLPEIPTSKQPNYPPCTEQALTTVVIDAQAIVHNINQYKNVVGPSVTLAPVIKSNAYGHGLILVAKICEEHPAVSMLCVAALSEALTLRQHGIKKPILVLSIIDADIRHAVKHDITLTVYNLKTTLQLNSIAQQLHTTARVHVKVDTGLHRLGIAWETAASFVKKIYTLPGITVEGIFSHFANSENEDQSFAQLQQERFSYVQQELKAHNITIPYTHISCSAAITSTLGSHGTLARLGIGIYGIWPSQHNKLITKKRFPSFNLIPALTWRTKIIHLQTIAAGQHVGYDLTWQAPEQRIIATLPVGYSDGYDRALSNNSYVMIHNKLAPVIGHIAMNLMMVDVTNIPNTAIGNTVILIGNHPGVTADDLAQRAGTIAYEIVTRINSALERTLF